MKWLTLCISLLLSSGDSFACQPCILFATSNRLMQVISIEGKPVAEAEVKLFLTKELEPNERSRHNLDCLDTYGIGRFVWSGKTNDKGVIDLNNIPLGQYWVAIKGKEEEAVYIIRFRNDLEHNKEPARYQIGPGGLVWNKCGVEPIEYFFK